MCLAFTPRHTSKGGKTSPKLPRMQEQSSSVSCGMLAGHLMQVISRCSARSATRLCESCTIKLMVSSMWCALSTKLQGCMVKLHQLAVWLCLASCFLHEQCAAAGMHMDLGMDMARFLLHVYSYGRYMCTHMVCLTFCRLPAKQGSALIVCGSSCRG